MAEQREKPSGLQVKGAAQDLSGRPGESGSARADDDRTVSAPVKKSAMPLGGTSASGVSGPPGSGAPGSGSARATRAAAPTEGIPMPHVAASTATQPVPPLPPPPSVDDDDRPGGRFGGLAGRARGRLSGVRPAPPRTSGSARRARLVLRRVDPWSVLRFSLALGVVLFLVTVVGVVVLYLILSAAGVFTKVDTLVNAIVSTKSSIFTAKNVIGVTAVVSAVEAALFVVLATLGAFVYNLCADLVGGIEVTLSEHE